MCASTDLSQSPGFLITTVVPILCVLLGGFTTLLASLCHEWRKTCKERKNLRSGVRSELRQILPHMLLCSLFLDLKTNAKKLRFVFTTFKEFDLPRELVFSKNQEELYRAIDSTGKDEEWEEVAAFHNQNAAENLKANRSLLITHMSFLFMRENVSAFVLLKDDEMRYLIALLDAIWAFNTYADRATYLLDKTVGPDYRGENINILDNDLADTYQKMADNSYKTAQLITKLLHSMSTPNSPKQCAKNTSTDN